MKSLSISGSSRYFGSDDWDIYAVPTGDISNVCSGVGSSRSCDFSMASDYSVEIYDPNNSKTSFTYTVLSNTPSSSSSFAGKFHDTFCNTHSSDSRCPDGASLSAMTLSKFPSATPVIANGTDTYDFILKIRDTYGNATSG
jgi:hypothetical protein